MATARDALDLLRAIDIGDVSVALADPRQDRWSLEICYVTPTGWQIVVFNDCGEWDYIDHLVSPDGR